jgi:DNA-binding transcriptional regulator YhcF (GntR family)
MASPAASARLRVRIRDGEGPRYEQLRDGIQRQIELGTLLPGERLPPVRAAADDLGLAPNTVARSYRALELEGWLVGRGRAGTFVTDRRPLVAEADDALAQAADVYLRRAAQLGFDVAEARKMLSARTPR